MALSSVTKEKKARKRRRDGTVLGVSSIGALFSRRRGLVFDFFLALLLNSIIQVLFEINELQRAFIRPEANRNQIITLKKL